MLESVAITWKELAGLFLGIIGILKYFDARSRELKWKKTEFLFRESRYLADDQSLSECIQILEDRHPEYAISDIYPDTAEGETPGILELKHQFDKLWNFFDRLAYAVFSQKTIQPRDLEYFGWYLRKIQATPAILNYCNQYGFEDVVRMAEVVAKNDQQNDRLSSEGPPCASPDEACHPNRSLHRETLHMSGLKKIWKWLKDKVFPGDSPWRGLRDGDG